MPSWPASRISASKTTPLTLNAIANPALWQKPAPLSEEVLTPETPGVVTPTQPHEVEPLGAVRLFVEFFSARSVEGGLHTSQVL